MRDEAISLSLSLPFAVLGTGPQNFILTYIPSPYYFLFWERVSFKSLDFPDWAQIWDPPGSISPSAGITDMHQHTQLTVSVLAKTFMTVSLKETIYGDNTVQEHKCIRNMKGDYLSNVFSEKSHRFHKLTEFIHSPMPHLHMLFVESLISLYI